MRGIVLPGNGGMKPAKEYILLREMFLKWALRNALRMFISGCTPLQPGGVREEEKKISASI